MQYDQVWLTTKAAARYIALSPTRLAHMRCQGIGPRFARVFLPGSRKPIVRYRREWLDTFLLQDQ